MPVKVHLRPVTADNGDTVVVVPDASAWAANLSAGLDLLDGDGNLVATFAGNAWLYVEVVE
jgi:hypothetical protein